MIQFQSSWGLIHRNISNECAGHTSEAKYLKLSLGKVARRILENEVCVVVQLSAPFE